jgi:hypothetical protein
LAIDRSPYALKIRKARAVPTPCECRKTMISRTARWSFHAAVIFA